LTNKRIDIAVQRRIQRRSCLLYNMTKLCSYM